MEYRKDIDGLRAIAVMIIVFFHLKMPFISGGFIGVDIFFVISGFLITSIIVRDVEANSFSLSNFYERRIRRILPAYFCVTICTLIASYFLFLPDSYVDISWSVIASNLYISNFFFYAETGYFQVAPEAQPLLHIWSLSLEEQYYILLPALILFLWQYGGQRKLLKVIGVTTFLSFVYSAIYVHHNTEFTFFMLPTRFWEFGVGSLLALSNIRDLKINVLSQLMLGVFGLLCIALPTFMYTKAILFPGLSALPVCVGVGVLIVLGKTKNIISTLLSLSPLTFIGKISYSLYLWHWPLIAFFSQRYGAPSFDQKLILLALSSR